MESINAKRDALMEYVEKKSEILLNYIYYYSGYDSPYNVETPVPKENKKIVYYHEFNLFNTLLFMSSIVFLLIIVYLYSFSCQNINSDSILTIIIEHFKCKEFILLFMSIVLISLSYIIGGPLRIILLIGFYIIACVVIIKKQNIDILTQVPKKIYKTWTTPMDNTLDNTLDK